jgi:hypothetical protein
MSTIRQIRLGQLDQLRREISKLELQAATLSVAIQAKNTVLKKDLAKLDVDAILQAATDLQSTVLNLRQAKEQADELNAELYD